MPTLILTTAAATATATTTAAAALAVPDAAQSQDTIYVAPPLILHPQALESLAASQWPGSQLPPTIAAAAAAATRRPSLRSRPSLPYASHDIASSGNSGNNRHHVQQHQSSSPVYHTLSPVPDLPLSSTNPDPFRSASGGPCLASSADPSSSMSFLPTPITSATSSFQSMLPLFFGRQQQHSTASRHVQQLSQHPSARVEAADAIADAVATGSNGRRGTNPFMPSSLSMLLSDPEMAHTHFLLQQEQAAAAAATTAAATAVVDHEQERAEVERERNGRSAHRYYEDLQEDDHHLEFRQRQVDYIMPHEPSPSSPMFPSPLAILDTLTLRRGTAIPNMMDDGGNDVDEARTRLLPSDENNEDGVDGEDGRTPSRQQQQRQLHSQRQQAQSHQQQQQQQSQQQRRDYGSISGGPLSSSFHSQSSSPSTGSPISSMRIPLMQSHAAYYRSVNNYVYSARTPMAVNNNATTATGADVAPCRPAAPYTLISGNYNHHEGSHSRRPSQGSSADGTERHSNDQSDRWLCGLQPVSDVVYLVTILSSLLGS